MTSSRRMDAAFTKFEPFAEEIKATTRNRHVAGNDGIIERAAHARIQIHRRVQAASRHFDPSVGG